MTMDMLINLSITLLRSHLHGCYSFSIVRLAAAQSV